MSAEPVASLRPRSHVCNDTNTRASTCDANRATRVAGVHRAWQFGVWAVEMEQRARSARNTFTSSVSVTS